MNIKNMKHILSLSHTIHTHTLTLTHTLIHAHTHSPSHTHPYTHTHLPRESTARPSRCPYAALARRCSLGDVTTPKKERTDKRKPSMPIRILGCGDS